MKVEVVKYDQEWPNRFISEKLLLKENLGDLIVEIHHIGSTSVPGLVAKPIIDIIIETYSLQAFDAQTPAMESLGYEVKGEFGIQGRRYLRKGASVRTHQIHAFKTGDGNVKRHIAFRDYLISHPEVMHKYADLKIKLAMECNDDIDYYCNGKNEFITYHEYKAIELIMNKSG